MHIGMRRGHVHQCADLLAGNAMCLLDRFVAPFFGYRTAAPDSTTSTLLAAALSRGDAASMKRPTRLVSP